MTSRDIPDILGVFLMFVAVFTLLHLLPAYTGNGDAQVRLFKVKKDGTEMRQCQCA